MRQKMRTGLRVLLVVSIVAGLFSAPVAAQADPGPLEPLATLLEDIATILAGIAVSIALLGTTWAGILYMMPDPETSVRARRVFVNAVFGLAIVGFSSVVVNWLAGRLLTL